VENNYLAASGSMIAELRLRIEGMITLYEEDTLVLLDLAAEKKLYHAAGSLDAIATALYDLRKQIVDLQAAYRNEVLRQGAEDSSRLDEIHLDE